MNKGTMKICLVALAVIMLMGVFTGCGSPVANVETTPTEVSAESTMEPTPSPEGKECTIGEVMATDNIEITLNYIEFGEKVDKGLSIDGIVNDNFFLPESGYLMKEASSGNTFLCYSYTIKYIGKTAQTFSYHNTISIDYNDGYTFTDAVDKFADVYYRTKKSWERLIVIELKPLSEQIEIRGCIEVPLEVKENTEGSLKVILTPMLSSGGAFKGEGEFVYIIR